MKTIIKTFVYSIIFLGITSNCFASPYILGELGAYGGELQFSSAVVSKRTVQVRPVERFAIGYLWDTFEPLKLGFEAGVQHHKRLSQEFHSYYMLSGDCTLKRNTIDLLAVADRNLTTRWNIFSKCGAAYINQNTKTNFNDINFSVSNNYLTPKIISGIGYQAKQNVNINLAYAYEFGKDLNSKSGTDNVMAGIKYNF